LLFERLENRQLLSAVPWEGEDCPVCTGPDTTSPQVATVDVSSDSIGVAFSEAVDVASAIGDASIVTVVSLGDVAGAAVPLAANQFSYDEVSWTLTVSLNEPLPDGTYDLRLDGSQVKDSAGNPLLGGGGGLLFGLPTFGSATMVQAGGADVQADNYSVPSLADWNGDGLTDLLVGEKTANSQGKVRVYLNSGTNAAPVYGSFSYARTAADDLAVNASGCMGVFPRVFDWDQDGWKDLVLGLADGTVQVALNRNADDDPGFAAPVPVQVGEPGAKSDIDVGVRATLDIVDWNNDDRYDLVLGDLDGNVHVLLNEADSGAPDFRSQTTVVDAAAGLGIPSGRSSVAVVDLNGDGRKDLVSGNTEGQLLFYPNAGNDAEPQLPFYQPIEADGTEIDLSGTPRSRPFVGDYNNDGKTDILVGAADGLVRLHAGSSSSGSGAGTGTVDGVPGGAYVHTFHAETAGNAAPWQGPVHAHDVNNDGFITALDALIVINHLNANGSQSLPVPPVPSDQPPPFLDCTGDGNVTPLDALQVINDLNDLGPQAVANSPNGEGGDGFSPKASGEGEAVSVPSLGKDGDVHRPAQSSLPNPSVRPRERPQDRDGNGAPSSIEEQLSLDWLDLEDALTVLVS